MNELFLFPKEEWSKGKIVETLNSYGFKIRPQDLRSGFNHLILVNTEAIRITDIETVEKIIIINYDTKTESVEKDAYIIENKEFKSFNIEPLLSEDPTNIIWDIKNFGFYIKPNKDINRIYSLINSTKYPGVSGYLKEIEIKELIEIEGLDLNLKKLLLDIYALKASLVRTTILYTENNSKDNHEQNFILKYTTIFTLTTISRTILEKLILIIGLIDKDLDYESLIGSKSIKRTFIKTGSKSIEPLTIELLKHITNIEILDENYRTPEIHKISRLLGMLSECKGEIFGSILNEIFSFQNWTTQFFKKICNKLKEENAC
jgi:hypothetical protein